MFASKLVLPAACLLFLRAAIAAPAPDLVVPETAADAAELGLPVEPRVAKTTTSVSTTTTTGVPAPGATDAKGNGKGKDKGETAVCHNTDGEFKPFCQPKHNEVYFPGSKHYVTWDPAFFQDANATIVQLLGFYTTNETHIPTSGPPSGEEEAFSSEHIAAGWGFYQWQVNKNLLSSQSASVVNITLRLVALPKDGHAAQWHTGPTVTLRYKPKKEPEPKRTKTDDHALYIVLPTVFSAVILIVMVTLCCTRQARRVDIEDLLSRSRKSSSRRKGLGGLSKKDRARNKEQNIRLMGREGAGADSDEESRGWDEGWSHEVPGGKRVDRKRV